jgi:transcriptional repressor NrdR
MTKIIKVKKRSGYIELFDPEKVKISIQKATIEAGYNLNGMSEYNLIDEVNKGIVVEAGEKNIIESSTIRKIILNQLKTAQSSITDS